MTVQEGRANRPSMSFLRSSNEVVLKSPAANASLSGQAYGFGLGNFRGAESVAFSADGNTIYVTLEGRHAPLLRIDINGALPE